MACRDIEHAESEARRNAGLVTTLYARIATQAGIFGEAPQDEAATATQLGLLLNLANVFLYMTNYNLVIPTMDDYCAHLGVGTSFGGALIGAAGAAPSRCSAMMLRLRHPALRVRSWQGRQRWWGAG